MLFTAQCNLALYPGRSQEKRFCFFIVVVVLSEWPGYEAKYNQVYQELVLFLILLFLWSEWTCTLVLMCKTMTPWEYIHVHAIMHGVAFINVTAKVTYM